VPIDVLPDNVVLEIFKFSLCDETEFSKYSDHHTRIWQTLAHVCQRGRSIIFASPRQLELYLTCSHGTPVRKNLGFWPVTIPLSLYYCYRITPEDEDNIVAVLEYPSRVHSIEIHAGAPHIKKVVAAMRKLFPALIHLVLTCYSSTTDSSPVSVIPRRFLGGSAPRLQDLSIKFVSFPHWRTLLLSARNLVTLTLNQILPDRYILPEVMAKSLATLPSLTNFSISCSEETSPTDQWQSRPDPPMRTTLPALTHFTYTGHSRYLEDFLAQVDIPRVSYIRIEYPMHLIQATQLSRFIERTENFKIDQFTRAEVAIFNEHLFIDFDCPEGKFSQAHLFLEILDEVHLETRVRGMVHILRQLVSIFFNVDVLFAQGSCTQRQSREVDITKWLPLFRIFPAVEVLRLSGRVGVSIASALEDATEEMVSEVLPALHSIRLEKYQFDNKDY
jgi:hypothetical protein